MTNQYVFYDGEAKAGAAGLRYTAIVRAIKTFG
jgi:hypothetical protein